MQRVWQMRQMRQMRQALMPGQHSKLPERPQLPF
jgi:hypothetical protein